jgi:septum site-determining protein MinD
MTARVITITSGKATATANLGVALAQLGHKVVTIDADVGLRNLDLVMGLENRIVYDLVDVIEGRCKLRQAMIRDKRLEGLYLLPAAQTRDKTAVSPSDMILICDELRTEYDFVLIDSPADEVVILTNPEVSSVRDSDRIIGLLEADEKAAPSLIVNRIKPEMVEQGDMLAIGDVLDVLMIKLIGIVPEDEQVLISTNRGLPAALANGSLAGQAFRNIARRIDGEDVPFLSLERERGLRGWLRRVVGSR